MLPQQQQKQPQDEEEIASVCKVRVEYLGPKRGKGIVATEDIDVGEASC